MTETIIELRKLVSAEGYTLFDGETLSKEIYLGVLDKPENWREITDEEAEEIRKEQESRVEEEANAARDMI